MYINDWARRTKTSNKVSSSKPEIHSVYNSQYSHKNGLGYLLKHRVPT